MLFSCFVFSARLAWYKLSCSATSGPGWRARIARSSTYNFSFCWISASLTATSSVFLINVFCSLCARWIIAYVAGSEPSSLRQRCTFIWFSSSSESARTLVRSCSSSRLSAKVSFRRASRFKMDDLSAKSSERSS